MSAPFDELEQEGRIEPVPTGQAEVERLHFGRIALSQHEHLFDRLDRLRQRRHRAVYSAVGQISSVEVRDALTLAGEVIPILKEAAGRVLKDRDGKGKGPNSSGGADR